MFEKLEIGPKSQAFWRRQTRNIRKTGGGPDKGAQRRSRILHKLGHDQIRKDTRRLGILSWTRFDPNETFAAHNQTARIDVERSSGGQRCCWRKPLGSDQVTDRGRIR
jgi:hypothetical protein